MKSTRERAEEKRVEKLEDIREQVANGRLVVRKMTEAERLQYPVKPNPQPDRPRYSGR